jgi:hypothetical protein
MDMKEDIGIMTIKDPCVGCSVYKNEDDYCNFWVHNTESEGICPCSDCIIKSMCRNECEEWAAWKDKKGDK